VSLELEASGGAQRLGRDRAGGSLRSSEGQPGQDLVSERAAGSSVAREEDDLPDLEGEGSYREPVEGPLKELALDPPTAAKARQGQVGPKGASVLGPEPGRAREGRA
tara:strand:- start:445 stop:765 length:321 start_codon:yes stop_codon:yes gene_type:complete